MDNTGGRVSYIVGEEVKVLDLNGTISKTKYQIKQEKSDRKGFVILGDKHGREIRVNHRRILNKDIEAEACVVEVGDKYKVVCPSCGYVDTIRIVADKYSCSSCSTGHKCHWMSIKPLKEIIKEVKSNKPRVTQMQKEDKVLPTVVDLASLSQLPNCVLYTKKNVKFDHERIDVKAHVLLCKGDSPRKMCFNTYNGMLGKKVSSLPVDDFVSGKDSPRFFKVADVAKTVEKLVKEGYEEHHA